MPTISIGANQYPAFQSVAGADAYLAADVARAASWALRNADAKARGLISATRVLLALPWCDEAPDPEAGDTPDLIAELTAELAADLLARPALLADASTNGNIKVAKAGSAQVEFFSPVEGAPPLPRAMWARLAAAGLVCTGRDDIGAGVEAFGISGSVRPLWGRAAADWPIAAEDFD